MTGYERQNSHIAYFLVGNIMWIKKNDLLVNLEKFDALYQDTLHPENLVIMTDQKKRTLSKIDDVPRVLDEITEAMKNGESVYVLQCKKKSLKKNSQRQ